MKKLDKIVIDKEEQRRILRRLRKKVPPPDRELTPKTNYNRGKARNKERELIEDGIEKYYNGEW